MSVFRIAPPGGEARLISPTALARRRRRELTRRKSCRTRRPLRGSLDALRAWPAGGPVIRGAWCDCCKRVGAALGPAGRTLAAPGARRRLSTRDRLAQRSGARKGTRGLIVCSCYVLMLLSIAEGSARERIPAGVRSASLARRRSPEMSAHAGEIQASTNAQLIERFKADARQMGNPMKINVKEIAAGIFRDGLPRARHREGDRNSRGHGGGPGEVSRSPGSVGCDPRLGKVARRADGDLGRGVTRGEADRA